MTIQDRLQSLKDHLSKQLRVKGDSFQELADRAGRRIPRKYRADLAHVVEVEGQLANPKLLNRLDDKRFTKAERRLRWFLDKQDPKAERMGEVLDRVAVVAFIVVVVTLSLFFYLISTGYFD